jgi:hypothetical protein
MKFSTPMAVMAKATDRGAANHNASSPNAFATQTPTSADTMCPPITFGGWANGDPIASYKRTAVAPNEPRIKSRSPSTTPIARCIPATAHSPTNEETPDHNVFLRALEGGALSPSTPLHFVKIPLDFVVTTEMMLSLDDMDAMLSRDGVGVMLSSDDVGVDGGRQSGNGSGGGGRDMVERKLHA